MEITNVKFYPYNKEKNNLKGFATVTLDDELVLTGIKLVKGNKGLFLSMPSVQWVSDEEYHDIFFPITAELRDELTEAVKDAYKDAQNEKPKKKSSSKKNKKKVEDDDEEEDD